MLYTWKYNRKKFILIAAAILILLFYLGFMGFRWYLYHTYTNVIASSEQSEDDYWGKGAEKEFQEQGYNTFPIDEISSDSMGTSFQGWLEKEWEKQVEPIELKESQTQNTNLSESNQDIAVDVEPLQTLYDRKSNEAYVLVRYQSHVQSAQPAGASGNLVVGRSIDWISQLNLSVSLYKAPDGTKKLVYDHGEEYPAHGEIEMEEEHYKRIDGTFHYLMGTRGVMVINQPSPDILRLRTRYEIEEETISSMLRSWELNTNDRNKR